MPRLGRFRLLSIGINRYLEWPRLETAVAGAVELAGLLGRDYGFEGARTLTDGEATRAAIIGELARLVDEAEPEDSVVIYFAGHGHIDPRTQTGSWIPVDAVADRTGQAYGASATWLPNSVVKDHLKACKARHVLLISDSCFAGDFLRGHREAPPVIDDAYVRRSFQHRSRLALTAGGVQPVVDAGLPGQSVFTGFLLHALRENDRPWYLPSELHVRIRSGVAANAPQQPLLGRLQDTGGEVDGEFVFFRRGYASLEMALEENRKRLAEAVRLKEVQESARKAQLEEVAAKKAELAEKERQLAELRKQSEALKSPAERASGLDQILALLSEIEERHEELKRREAELAEARRVEEARLEAERKERLAEARKQFEVEKGKYEKVIGSPFADAGMKRTAWQLFCGSQGVIARDPENPGKLEWAGDGVRELEISDVLESSPASSPIAHWSVWVWPSYLGALLFGGGQVYDGNGSSSLMWWGQIPFVWLLFRSKRKLEFWICLVCGFSLLLHPFGLWQAYSACRREFSGRTLHAQMASFPTNPLPHQKFTTPMGHQFVFLPAGQFVMGSPVGEGDDNEHPQTQVTLTRGFWMSTHEVTHIEWNQVMGDPYLLSNAHRPVTPNWHQCLAFCRKLTRWMPGKIPHGYEFRLPTEAEWEYACRAGTTTKWSFGEDESALKRYAWFYGNRDEIAHGEPRRKMSNAWGLYDMYGGVSEWCMDWMEAYPGGQIIDPKGPTTGMHRVKRGGSCYAGARDCRSASRSRDEPGSKHSGLRLVLGPRL